MDITARSSPATPTAKLRLGSFYRLDLEAQQYIGVLQPAARHRAARPHQLHRPARRPVRAVLPAAHRGRFRGPARFPHLPLLRQQFHRAERRVPLGGLQRPGHGAVRRRRQSVPPLPGRQPGEPGEVLRLRASASTSATTFSCASTPASAAKGFRYGSSSTTFSEARGARCCSSSLPDAQAQRFYDDDPLWRDPPPIPGPDSPRRARSTSTSISSRTPFSSPTSGSSRAAPSRAPER